MGRSIVVFFAILAVMVLTTQHTAYAQQSELKQQILAPDCGAEVCEMTPPTIVSIHKNKNKPIITGTYDAAFSKHLRIIFGERVYTLGIDQQLAVLANDWQLDLSDLEEPLVVGVYELIVETEGFDGEVKQATMTTTIAEQELGEDNRPDVIIPKQVIPNEAPETVAPNEQPGIHDPKNIPQPMTQDEVQAKASLVPLIVTLGSVITFFVLGSAWTWYNQKKP